MDFINDVGKKITEAGQKAVKSTQNVAESARLNSQISEAEKNLNTRFQSLGKYVFLNYKESDLDGGCAGIFEAIRESQDLIAQYKSAQANVSSFSTCNNCNHKIPANAKFCPGCGSPTYVPEPAQPSQAHCPNCGVPVSPGAQFCSSCGTGIGG